MKVLKILLLLCVVLVQVAVAQQSADIVSYINQYKELAIEEMQRTGVPASIKLAQGIHETMAGTSDLVLKSNNHFGIKCKTGWSGEKVYHDDDARGECFRSYEKAEDSYRDHSDFLRKSNRYAFLFQLPATDYKGWAYGLKKAGYATNIKYSQILVKLIETYDLQQYSLLAMEKNNASPKEVTATPDVPVAVAEKQVSEVPVKMVVKPAPQYPEGVFTINQTKVLFAKEGTSLLAIANNHQLTLSKLLEFNDMEDEEGDVLAMDQLLFLQRKRKQGAVKTHMVSEGEILYDIAQAEGVRYESLLELNHLRTGMEPAAGEIIYLQSPAPARPLLAGSHLPVNETTKITTTQAAAITHQVQTSETLYSISRKYAVSVESLMAWNKLPGMDIKIGQQLIIYKN